jgi:uncharacterized membrane protein
MFDRVAYKKAAKAQLKGRWKIPVLTSLLIFALISILGFALVAFFGDDITVNLRAGAGNFNAGVHGGPRATTASIFIALIIAAFLLAQKRLFHTMKADPRPISFGDYLEGLGQWWQAARGYLWRTLWVFLWSLLLWIPGIIKWYSYSMMVYIMAENPEIKVTKAMNISKELTRGYKGDLFVTDLSFIPLYLLCCLTMGIGFLWLMPYYQATYTNIYHALKETAFASKRVAPEDFA